MSIIDFYPVINNIEDEYVTHRRNGKNRAESIDLILSAYLNDLRDVDERVAIMQGLSLVLMKRNELTQLIGEQTIEALDEAYQFINSYNNKDPRLHLFEQFRTRISDPSVYGEEAEYKIRKPYVPNWQIGDTFAHRIICPRAESLDICGWYILIRKIGEYVDCYSKHRQLVFVTVCPPEKIPTTSAEMEALGCLRVMKRGRTNILWEYTCQMEITSKRSEKQYQLVKIGHFPDVKSPTDQADDSSYPYTLYPLFGKMGNAEYPGYEDSICRFFEVNGFNDRLIQTN